MSCSYSHLPGRMAVRAVGKKTGVIHLGATCHREFIIITHAHIIKCQELEQVNQTKRY